MFLKKRLTGFINFILLFALCISVSGSENNVADSDSSVLIYENKAVADAFKIAVPTVVFATVLTIALNEDFRWYFADRWTRFTSPNHASPDQYREFYFKPWSEEIEQETQCDKGVHFIFSYLPVMPIATLLDRSYYAMTSGKIKNKISDWSVVTASVIVVGFGIMEEYMDGHQKGEGFDPLDFTANATGVSLALLKHYGIMEDVYFYWSFNRDMFDESGYGDKWPWWIYMAGYEFYVQVDVLSFMRKSRIDNQIFKSVVETVGYLPDFKSFWKLKYNNI
jgi:hypothetical protein